MSDWKTGKSGDSKKETQEGWSTVFNDTVDGRPVTGMVFKKNSIITDYLIESIAIKEEGMGGENLSDESNTVIMPPVVLGDSIEIPGSDLEDLLYWLKQSDFTEEQAKLICSKFI